LYLDQRRHIEIRQTEFAEELLVLIGDGRGVELFNQIRKIKWILCLHSHFSLLAVKCCGAAYW
jgi:hypothetical protein